MNYRIRITSEVELANPEAVSELITRCACAALEQENLIEGTESQYGLYVTSVDGEAADESKQEWWGYSVNGTFAELGVDSQPVADGDVYDFVLNVGW